MQTVHTPATSDVDLRLFTAILTATPKVLVKAILANAKIAEVRPLHELSTGQFGRRSNSSIGRHKHAIISMPSVHRRSIPPPSRHTAQPCAMRPCSVALQHMRVIHGGDECREHGNLSRRGDHAAPELRATAAKIAFNDCSAAEFDKHI